EFRQFLEDMYATVDEKLDLKRQNKYIGKNLAESELDERVIGEKLHRSKITRRRVKLIFNCPPSSDEIKHAAEEGAIDAYTYKSYLKSKISIGLELMNDRQRSGTRYMRDSD